MAKVQELIDSRGNPSHKLFLVSEALLDAGDTPPEIGIHDGDGVRADLGDAVRLTRRRDFRLQVSRILITSEAEK